MIKSRLFSFVLAVLFACQIAATAKAQLAFSPPTAVANINFPGPDWATSISVDASRLYFTSVRGGGQGDADTWVSTWDDTAATWGTPQNAGLPVNSEFTETNPTISSDGQFLYFSDYLDAAPSKQRPGGMGMGDIWISQWNATASAWETPTNNAALTDVNTEHFEGWQTLSADGQTLVFASDRPGGQGETDLWISEWDSPENKWTTPINLGPDVNSDSFEGAPALSPDGLSLFFGSRRDGGLGGNDIWVTNRTSNLTAWQPPVNLGDVVNSSAWEGDVAVSPDGATLFFTSDRNVGGAGVFGVYQSQIVPEPSGLIICCITSIGVLVSRGRPRRRAGCH